MPRSGSGIEPAFLDTLSQDYDSGIYLADFAGDPEGTRKNINGWALELTAGRIVDLLPTGALSANTGLVLTNAVYLSAPWKYRFDPLTTQNGAFTLPSGDQVTVQIMGREEYFAYVFDPNWRAAELPYADSSLSMIVVLPNEQEFAAFEAAFDATRLSQIVDGLANAAALQANPRLYLGLPRFSFDASVDLKDPLQALGMTDAFSLAGLSAALDAISRECPAAAAASAPPPAPRR